MCSMTPKILNPAPETEQPADNVVAQPNEAAAWTATRMEKGQLA